MEQWQFFEKLEDIVLILSEIRDRLPPPAPVLAPKFQANGEPWDHRPGAVNIVKDLP